MKNFITIFIFSLLTTCAFAQHSWAQGSTEVKIVKFYPNPATSFITFDIQRQVEKGYVIQIYNCLGRRVISVVISSNKVTVPLENLFRGLYIFQLRDKNGSIVESNKFQVNN
ncbi:MAG: T9SS type A sorting domain-containing protein [Chitinophagaceae bacterium]